MESVTSKSSQEPYVTHDAGVLAGAVVLRPSTAIDRLVPIAGEPSPIAERALAQHEILVATLRDRGVALTVLDPVLESGAESLVSDVAIVVGPGAIVTRPSSVERRGEIVAIEGALERLGIPIVGRIVAPGLLDANDVALGRDTLYVGVPRPGAGLRARSNALGRAQLAQIANGLGLRTIELTLAPSVLRLRNVFNFVGSETIVVASQRVDTTPLTGFTLVDLPLGEEYAAGLLALGERRVLANLRFRESLALLRRAKIAVEAIDLWEFGKAGAGPLSLVLATNRR